MPNMITKLTPAQEAEIPKFVSKWVANASEPTDRVAATKAVQDMYAAMGEEKPIVIFGESPFSTAVMGAIVWSTVGPKNKEKLDSQLGSQLDSQLRSQLRSQLGSINTDYWVTVWWLASSGWFDYGQYIGVEFDKEKYDLFMAFVSNVGFIIPYKGIAFVSDNPTRIVWDEAGRLSYDHDQAVKYQDGWGLYCLDGVTFKEDEWKRIVGQEFTLEELVKEGMGADKSAVAIKYLRPDLLLEHCHAKLIHTGIKGTRLYEVKNFLDTGKTQYCMRMKHPSIEREYIEWVEPEVGKLGNADLAQCHAWKDQDGDPIPLEDYLLAVES